MSHDQKEASRFDFITYTTDGEGLFADGNPAVKLLKDAFFDEALHESSWYRFVSPTTNSSLPIYSSIIHPDDKDLVEQKLTSAFKNVKGFQVEYRIVGNNGKRIWVAEEGRFVDSGNGKIKLQGVLFNITEMKRAEQINKALFQISNAISTTYDLDELYRSIHSAMKLIVTVDQFFIAIYNEQEDSISFPYNTDSIDKHGSEPIENASQSTSFTWKVIQTQKPLLLNKEEQFALVRELGGEIIGLPSELWLGVPLIVRNKVIGAMVAQSYTEPNLYSLKDIEVFNSVSDQIAFAIERKQWEENTFKRDHLIQTLFEISSAINTTGDLNELYRTIHQSLSKIVAIENFYIAMYDRKTDHLAFPYYVDSSDNFVPPDIYDVKGSASLTGEMLRRGKLLILKSEEQLALASKLGGTLIGNLSETWIGVPLVVNDQVIGAMVTQNYVKTSEEDCKRTAEILVSVSDQVALAIDRKQAVENQKRNELQLKALYNISKATHDSPEIELFFQKIVESLDLVVNGVTLSIALYDRNEDIITIPHSTDNSLKGLEIPNASSSSAISYRVIHQGKTLVLNRKQQIDFVNDVGGKAYCAISESWVGIPLYLDKQAFGVIIAQSDNEPGKFDDHYVELLEMVSEQVAIVFKQQSDKERIQKAHEDLEKKVTIRTNQLATTNEELEAEITVRQLTEAKLIFAKQQAEKANLAKSEFLANMSHELRTPMHHILNYTRMGSERIDRGDTKKLKHYFNQANDSAKKLMRLLDDLLDISKLEAGKMIYTIQNNNIKKIVENVIQDFRFILKEKDLQVLIEESEADLVVPCDLYRVGQVIQNLLTNAIKFSPNGKTITFRFESHKISGSGANFLKTSITDQGVGIPPSELLSIFDKFTQSSKTNTGAGGTGLGLAICQEIIRGHNGAIWAKNHRDGGSIIMFTLPYNQSIQVQD